VENLVMELSQLDVDSVLLEEIVELYGAEDKFGGKAEFQHCFPFLRYKSPMGSAFCWPGDVYFRDLSCWYFLQNAVFPEWRKAEQWSFYNDFIFIELEENKLAAENDEENPKQKNADRQCDKSFDCLIIVKEVAGA
jgi:hypothetical protein